MDVTSIPSAEAEVMDGDVQASTALRRAGLTAAVDGLTVRTAEVTFRPGERTKFHTHDGIQVLYVTSGTGVVATCEEERTVTEGDLVLFEPGEEHWHGTGEGAESSFSHLYFMVGGPGAETTVVE